MSPSPFEMLVLDVDGGVSSQERLVARYGAKTIPLRDRTAGLRFWCREEEMMELRRLVASSGSSDKPKAIFYGSGDYHHLAYLGIGMIREPVTVVHFDNHTDYWREEFVDFLSMERRRNNSRFFNYGSWVVAALRLPQVKKFVQFGVDGDFTAGNYLPVPKGRRTHALDLLLEGRTETYPNRMRCSTLLGRISGSLACADFRPGLFTTRARWKSMAQHGGVLPVIEEVVSRIDTEAVYVTIDKDVLDERDSFSAYPGFSGSMRLGELVNALRLVARRRRIVGLDVCGDASAAWAIQAIRESPSATKRAMARRQYGRIPLSEFSSPANVGKNEDVNLRIMEHAAA